MYASIIIFQGCVSVCACSWFFEDKSSMKIAYPPFPQTATTVMHLISICATGQFEPSHKCITVLL